MANRGRFEIMAHILGLCMKPQVKTRIMYEANISFYQFETYAALLKTQGLLAHEANKYKATEKGLRFVNAFSQLQNTIEDLPIPNGGGQRVGVRAFSSLFAR
jgi:predicted transcriptional regulator